MIEISPVIISASRVTDIPAFFSGWFFGLFNKKIGYVDWINPYNYQISRIKFDKTELIVFWTKNPEPILPYLHILDEVKIEYYFQYTVNNYDKKIEPKVPDIEKRIETFINLSSAIGKERVIWRFDPLILTEDMNIFDLLNRVKYVGDRVYKYTNKMVFSFVDLQYMKVVNRFWNNNVMLIDYSANNKLKYQMATEISEMNKLWGLELQTCAEDLGLEILNIKQGRCVDDWLIRDKYEFTKDKSQRKLCGCVVSKDIGKYNTCGHNCVYCYANS